MHAGRLTIGLVTAALAALAACADSTAPASSIVANAAKGVSGGGGGGGGGGTTTPPPSILPSTPPAPDILVRESFGLADGLRPEGGNGTLKSVFGQPSLNGFWVEYPGSKDTQWIDPDVGQTWFFTSCSADPYELPSPLQQTYTGCAVSQWNTPPTSYPTALMPLTVSLPSTGYELSMEGYPAPIPNAYIAIGFTNSNAVNSNLTTSGTLWLRVRDLSVGGLPLTYELRTGSLANGTVIASGTAGMAGWNQMAIRYSPAAGTVTLSFAGETVGTYPVSIPTPKYAAFEGVGVLDDFVLRQ